MLAAAIARYLAAQGLVTFDESGLSGDTFIAVMPSAPDSCVAIFPTGGFGADGKLGYDSPTIQIRVRGTQDPRPAYQRAEAIYGALHGLHDVTLPGGPYVVGCWGIQSGPVHMGRDQNGRHEYSLNFRLEIRAVTAHRE